MLEIGKTQVFCPSLPDTETLLLILQSVPYTHAENMYKI